MRYESRLGTRNSESVPSLKMTIFSDPSIPELILLNAGEAVLLDAKELVLLDAGECVLLDAEDLVLLDAGEPVLLDTGEAVLLDACTSSQTRLKSSTNTDFRRLLTVRTEIEARKTDEIDA